MPCVSVSLRAAAACLIMAAGIGHAPARTVPIERRIAHPNGVSMFLKELNAGADSIVLSAAIANPTGHPVRLNRARSFMLEEGAHGIHHLNPPIDNPEVAIPPGAHVNANLVFIGPLAPGARQVTLSSNSGIGTADNPYDDAPAFRVTLPVPERGDETGEYQASHPDGVVVRVLSAAAGAGRCVVSLSASNGSDRTIVLNRNGGLALTDEHGAAAALDPPAANRELAVPPATRLDADLVFGCRNVDAAAPLTLTTNRGTAGTPDNPYDTLPVLTLRLRAARLPDGSPPAASHASGTPIARSTVTAASESVAAAAPPPAKPRAPPAPTMPSSAPVVAPAPPPIRPPHPAPEKSAGEKTVPQLEAALHAEHTDRGLHLVIPGDSLFDPKKSALGPAADPLLTGIARIIAATRPRDVIVTGHTDSAGEDDANLALSKERAHAVAAWLEAHAPKQRPHFEEEGFGRTRPVAPNHKADGSDNPEGRAQNRRVEVLLRRR